MKERTKLPTKKSVPTPKPAYPRNFLGSWSAKSAVTGGHPEEINEMPPPVTPKEDNRRPVFLRFQILKKSFNGAPQKKKSPSLDHNPVP